MVYSVKNVKSFMGREGYGYSCSLYKDGKKIGTVTDTADGGEADLYLDSPELEEELYAYVRSLPLEIFEGDEFAQSVETVIGGLVDAYLTKKQIDKLTAKSWVYIMKGSENKFSSFPKKYSKVAIEKQFADKIIECVNDRKELS